MSTATVHLYDLVNARDILDEFLAESDGEVTPAIEELLEQLEGQTTEKVERVALYIREQLATATAIKEEEQRLAARRKAKERAAEGLKDYLQRQLERLGKSKVDGLLCTVALQKSPPSVTCALEQQQLRDLLNTEWSGCVTVIPESYKLESRAVVELWKLGKGYVPQGVVVTQGHHVRIR